MQEHDVNVKGTRQDFCIKLCRQLKQRFDFPNEKLLFVLLFEPHEALCTARVKIVPHIPSSTDLEEPNIESQLVAEVGGKSDNFDIVNFWAKEEKKKNPMKLVVTACVLLSQSCSY